MADLTEQQIEELYEIIASLDWEEAAPRLPKFRALCDLAIRAVRQEPVAGYVPDGWSIKRHERSISVVAPDGSGVIAELGQAESRGLSCDILYMLADAMLRAAPLSASVEQARREALEEAARVCELEHLDDPTDSSDDIAYDNAVNDCVKAIRALAQGGKPYPVAGPEGGK